MKAKQVEDCRQSTKRERKGCVVPDSQAATLTQIAARELSRKMQRNEEVETQQSGAGAMSERRLNSVESLQAAAMVLRVLRERLRNREGGEKSQSYFRSVDERFQRLVARWREVFTKEFERMMAARELDAAMALPYAAASWWMTFSEGGRKIEYAVPLYDVVTLGAQHEGIEERALCEAMCECIGLMEFDNHETAKLVAVMAKNDAKFIESVAKHLRWMTDSGPQSTFLS